MEFLRSPSSPLHYFAVQLDRTPFIPGTGEFGAGFDNDTAVYNVVQNNLVRLCLLAAADMEEAEGDRRTAEEYRTKAQKLDDNLLKHFVDADGGWIWCIRGEDLQPDEKILSAPENIGFAGINGVAAMSADVSGLQVLQNGWPGAAVCRRTFERLNRFPDRKAIFDQQGMYIQFDQYCGGRLTSPSYGQGYAIQTMLLLDRLDMAEKALQWLATQTYQPPSFYAPDRLSPFHFYERYFAPDAPEKTDTDQGCGALNLVNVGEPLKIARLLAGIDNTNRKSLRLLPRLPDSWDGYAARHWPLVTEGGIVYVDITYRQKGDHGALSLHTYDGRPLPALELPPQAENRHPATAYTDVEDLELTW